MSHQPRQVVGVHVDGLPIALGLGLRESMAGAGVHLVGAQLGGELDEQLVLATGGPQGALGRVEWLLARTIFPVLLGGSVWYAIAEIEAGAEP